MCSRSSLNFSLSLTHLSQISCKLNAGQNQQSLFHLFSDKIKRKVLLSSYFVASSDQCCYFRKPLYNHGLEGLGKSSTTRFDKSKTNDSLSNNHTEIIFGLHPVLLALKSNRRDKTVLYMRDILSTSDRPIIQKLLELCQQKSIDIKLCNKSKLDKLSSSRPHQGVCLEASPLEFKRLKSSCMTSHISSSENTSINKSQLWLVLDSVQDPMNFGAILRSAYYLGVDQIFVTERNSSRIERVKSYDCALSPVVSKASSGVMEIVQICSLSNLSEFLKICKSHGWVIYGTAATEVNNNSDSENLSTQSAECSRVARHVPLHLAQVNNNTVLILGNEGRGLNDSVVEQCDGLLSIESGRELTDGVDSLNVSVATGILLYELCRARRFAQSL